MSSNPVPPTPTLSEKHSGIPSRLYEKAQYAKSLIVDIATKEQNDRKRGVAIPAGVEKNTYMKAFDELAQQLGKENVELNDQPLKDGWYMEREYIVFFFKSACANDVMTDLMIDPNTHDAMHVLDEEEFVASAVVYPGSTEEVQKIVLWANKYKIPIFPISIGRNRKLLVL